ncbi:hypothetical protein K491DRAFT_701513 [Lophiostoma macrostomum CBS 122681]|uniref:C2H2-type domain-containing protein n=1 Tax=Lophiostoma macrostomum CBS 122681 TaxID=1314788 RepID=A0A6A6TML7_9PLEO|nr:hypothetical protein K491DRAFT_701513 [Lophiostoma macrostomum CBS 122681]
MTPRSPKQQSKSSTVSRKLRIRADQNISVLPPELPQLRGIRSRRAATLPTTRRISVNYHPERLPVNYQNEEPQSSVWDPCELDPFTRSNSSHPSGLEQNPPSDLLSQSFNFPPYQSPQRSPVQLEDSSNQPEPSFQAKAVADTTLLPSPLSPLSGGPIVADYELHLPSESKIPHDPSVELQDMSTLGFMVPAQYGSLDHYGSPAALNSPNYVPMNQHHYSDSRSAHQLPSTSGPYAASYTSSSNVPSQNQPRSSTEPNVLPPYQPRSPYQQTMGSMRASPTPMSYPPSSGEPSPMLSASSHAYSYPAPHGSVPSQGMTPLASNTSSYPPHPIYPASSYEVTGYNSLPPTMYPPSSTSAAYPSYEPQPNLAAPNPGSVAGLPSSPSAQTNGVMPRVLNSRPKPQCWEHGCNGRQFSTFSNLLRHQREKSGTATKSYCPRCGAEFTRTTARNGHMQHEKCKQRRTSDSSR